MGEDGAVNGAFLSRHKHTLGWLHIGAVVGTVLVVVPVIAWTQPFAPASALLVFVLCTVAFSQNIGLVHHCAHHLPHGPRWLGLATGRLLHYLGGLPYVQTRLAHRLHHAHLGTALDPDRLGYTTTTTMWRRLRYLLMIGPLRARFAPVDLSSAIDAMSDDRRAAYHQQLRRDRRFVAAAQLALIALCGWYYPVVVAALLAANVLSNAREMAEHGNDGAGAYVNIRVSPLGVLLFSTPGFWFHGAHHTDPSVHYLDLPDAAPGLAARAPLPYLRRDGVITYLFNGR
jgi:fatty acid desaturase